MHDDRHRDDLMAKAPDGSDSPPDIGEGDDFEIEFIDDDEEPDELSDVVAAGAAAGQEAVGHEVLLQEVARLKKEHEELHEMYLRKLAEFDNFRKRTIREREELRKTAAEGVIRELLPVVDNFERALEHLGNGEQQAVGEGIAMIARQLWDVLQREGVEVIDPVGQPFEPELHEAVQRVEDSDQPPGTVVTVVVKGYSYCGRLLRPAMVTVAVDRAPAASSEHVEVGDEDGTRS
jgi:molecular chaperone GrpE